MFRIKIHHLGIEENGILIANDIDISLKRGETLGIIGPTGSGKTSILRLIAGFSIANNFTYEADISYKGISFTTDEYKRYISFSFQEAEDQFLLNTVDNEVYLPLSPRHSKIADNLFKHFDLTQKKDNLIRDLSTGQKKVIATISALSLDRDIMIFDEPIANMDTTQAERFVTYIKKIKSDKIILISSHEESLEDVYDKILFFNNNNRELLSLTEYQKRKSTWTQNSLKRENSDEDSIVLSNIYFHYQNRQEIFKDISCTIKKGDIILLSGDNGSGKTTLVNLITGKLLPSKGNITRAYKRLGMIFQEPEKQLFGNSIESEVHFDERKHTNTEHIQYRLKEFGLIRNDDFHPYFLSRGQKQALLILSIIHKSPDLLIIDEPFTGLDKELIKKIFDLLDGYYKKTNCTIIFTNQNIEGFDIKRIRNIQVKDKCLSCSKQ